MSNEQTLFRVLSDVIPREYGLEIEKMQALNFHKQLFAFECKSNRWFLKIRQAEEKSLFLERLYGVLFRREFPTIYPRKNVHGDFVTVVGSRMVQIFPFVEAQPFFPRDKAVEIIDLLCSFYNIVNKDSVLKRRLDDSCCRTMKAKLATMLSSDETMQEVKKFFLDFDSLYARANEYVRQYDALQCCHCECSMDNLHFTGQKILLIDFDSVGLYDHRLEITQIVFDLFQSHGALELDKIKYILRMFNQGLMNPLKINSSDAADLETLFFINKLCTFQCVDEDFVLGVKILQPLVRVCSRGSWV